MYAVVRRYSADVDSMDEIRRRIDDEFLPRMTDAKGFVSYYAFDDGNGGLTSVSIFLTKEEADTSVEIARQWVSERSPALPSATEVFGGEIFSHGGN